MTRQALWDRLCKAGLAHGPVPAIDAERSPWYIRLMQGVAGWLGALFVFSFAAAAFSSLIQHAAGALLAGVLCCGAATAFFKSGSTHEFGQQFALAGSLAGQGLLMTGLNLAFRGQPLMVYLAAFAVEALLAGLVANFNHRLLACLGAMLALSLALGHFGWAALAAVLAAGGCAHAWLRGVELRRYAPAADAFWRPFGYAMALALLAADAATAAQASANWQLMMGKPLASALAQPSAAGLLAVVLVATVARLLNAAGVAPTSRAGVAALGAAVLAGLLGFAAHGLAGALLILLLGHGAANRILLGLGLFALAAFLSHYYYSLQATLLAKSMVLAASGALLLAARPLMLRWLGTERKDGHA